MSLIRLYIIAETAPELASQRIDHQEIKKKDINLIPSQPKKILILELLKTKTHIKQKKSFIFFLNFRTLMSIPIYQSIKL